MADIADKIQALMNEFYNEWNNEENKGKGKWDVLGEFSQAHQIAVAFGNFNYQVENGGLSQWICNGYFHDDAEKLTEFLEVGKELDERCGEILDKVYKLEQCARETDCDRGGYYHDSDDNDGEGGFIGDMIDCNAFDSWYYEHCGKEDWWGVVSRIIDKVQEYDVAPNKPTLQAYIENAHDSSIGGFTMPLPATKEDLQPFLEGAEITDWQDIKIWDISSDISGLGSRLEDIISENGMTPITLDELNYLAVRLGDLDEAGQEVFAANLEAGKNCGSIAELINLTYAENIDRFDCWPAYNPAEYGNILINQFMQDEHAIAFNRLKDSANPEDNALAVHIEKLEKHTDLAAFGRTTAKEEGGIFTKQGYLVGGDGLQTLYRDSADIPDQHRLLTVPGIVKDFLMKIDDTNIPEAIMKLHAVGCKSMEHAVHNVKNFIDEHKRIDEYKRLAENPDGNFLSNHYLLTLNQSDIIITPTLEAYKAGSDTSKFISSVTELASKEQSDIKVFALRVNSGSDIDGGDISINADIRGDLIELNPKSLQNHINRNAVIPDRVDALHDDGTKKSYNLLQWSELLQRSELLQSQQGNSDGLFTYHYNDYDFNEVAKRFIALLSSHEMASVAMSFEEHLPRIDAAYRNTPASVEASQPNLDLIYIANEAAKEILAHGDADVYRITGVDAVKLSTVDAARSATFSEHHNFAIKQKDTSGLEAWAKRKVSDVVRKMEKETQRQTGRDSNKKPYGEEL